MPTISPVTPYDATAHALALCALAEDVCAHCLARIPLTIVNGVYTHFPEPCAAAEVWLEKQATLDGRLN